MPLAKYGERNVIVLLITTRVFVGVVRIVVKPVVTRLAGYSRQVVRWLGLFLAVKGPILEECPLCSN
jgi:hypothetical protein